VRFGRPPPPVGACLLGLAIFWTLVNVPFFTVVRYAHPYYALALSAAAAGIDALLFRGDRGR